MVILNLNDQVTGDQATSLEFQFRFSTNTPEYQAIDQVQVCHAPRNGLLSLISDNAY